MKRNEIFLQLTFLVKFIKQQRMHILLASGQGSSTHQYFVSWIDKKSGFFLIIMSQNREQNQLAIILNFFKVLFQ